MEITITTPFRSATFDLPTDMVMQIMMEAVEATCGIGKAPGIRTEEHIADPGKKVETATPVQEADAEAPKQRLAAKPDFPERMQVNKPFVFRPGSRNEHLFGKGAGPGVTVDAPEQKEGYKGFLMMKCEHCGEVRGTCAKFPMVDFYCKKCGQKTALHDLKPVRIKCKCGRDFRYRTNRDEDEFEWECIECGANVDVVYNSRRDSYQSL